MSGEPRSGRATGRSCRGSSAAASGSGAATSQGHGGATWSGGRRRPPC